MATVRCEEIANEKCGSFLANEVGCPFSLKILRIHRLVLCYNNGFEHRICECF